MAKPTRHRTVFSSLLFSHLNFFFRGGIWVLVSLTDQISLLGGIHQDQSRSVSPTLNFLRGGNVRLLFMSGWDPLRAVHISVHFLKHKRDFLYLFKLIFPLKGGGPRTTPDLHAGGSGFKSRWRPTNFGAHLPYTPPPGRKDVSRVPKGMVYAKAEHPG